MEAIAALGLAGNIITFIDFSGKLIGSTKEIYNSATGITKGAAHTKQITGDLHELTTKISGSQHPHAKQCKGDICPDALCKLAKACQATASELLAALSAMEAKKTSRKWDCFRSSLASVWKEGQIRQLEDRLSEFREQIILHLISLQRMDQSSILRLLQRLQRENATYQVQLYDQIDDLKKHLLRAFSNLEAELLQQQDEHDPKSSNLLRQQSFGHRDFDLQQRNTKIDVAATISSMTDGTARAEVISIDFQILGDLRFEQMELRHKKVADAHTNTYEWMYKTKFADWLSSRSSMFWITGKPGSGKSTMMKFLVENEETAKMMSNWSGQRPLMFGAHFFWINGSALQRSQEGLLRSLLYNILRQKPTLIKEAFPTRWKARAAGQVAFEELSRADLLTAFKTLARATSRSIRFCLFVDGLDEYDGDHEHLIDLLNELVLCENFKLCIASRPWNVFHNAFGEHGANIRMLKLEDFNKADIRKYAQDKIGGRADFQALALREPRANGFIEEIATKAEGVFLWAYLVVRSLVQGLQNKDRIEDFERRLRSFPSDLDEFFRSIFTSLEVVYRIQVARGFQIALTASSTPSALNYHFLDEEESNPRFIEDIEVKPVRQDKLNMMVADITTRVNGRFKGLLEVTEDIESISFPLHHHVDFLHRTVRDFLFTKATYDMMVSWNPDFDPDLVLCKIILAELKSIMSEAFFDTTTFWPAVPTVRRLESFCYHAAAHAERVGKIPTELLDDLESTMQRHKSNISTRKPVVPNCLEFLTFILPYNFGAYPESKIRKLPEPTMTRKWSLLDIVSTGQRNPPNTEYLLNPRVLRLLLQMSPPVVLTSDNVKSILELMRVHLQNNYKLNDMQSNHDMIKLIQTMRTSATPGAVDRSPTWLEIQALYPLEDPATSKSSLNLSMRDKSPMSVVRDASPEDNPRNGNLKPGKWYKSPLRRVFRRSVHET